MRSGTAIRGCTREGDQAPDQRPNGGALLAAFGAILVGAQTVLHQVQKDFPDYSYKEAALNPTNPSDRATPWEADIINVFKRDRELAEFVATRDTPTELSLTFARPFRLTDAARLSGHSTPAAAPPTMVDLYGKGNGYGWELNDVIGAQNVRCRRASRWPAQTIRCGRSWRR